MLERRALAKLFRCIVFVIAILPALPAVALDASGEWRPLVVTRFGNIDAIDAEDGPLAAFLKNIRNDGRFPPPMKTLIGPAIRNPTFFGLTFEAWLESVVLAPGRPGPVAALWVFPVDNRDEYLTQLSNQGLTEYEGMDGVTVLREMDQDGNFHTWHLEWLPGNLAVFGRDREAVAACRRIYAENSAAHGLLAGVDGQYVMPDIAVSLDPAVLAGWQDKEPGQYWWRGKIDKLTRDLIEFWQPNPARIRLINALSEDFALWPRRMDRLLLSAWFEEDGVEWRLDVAGDGGGAVVSQLDVFRRLPERTAMAYGTAVTPESFRSFGQAVGRMLLGGAGGVVTAEARQAAVDLFDLLLRAELTQAATAWVLPPTGRPEMGGARVMVGEWNRPQDLDAAWALVLSLVEPGTPVAQALSQMGWDVSITAYPHIRGAAEIVIRPAGEEAGLPYYDAAFVVRRSDGRVALVGGANRSDPGERRAVLQYRATIAQDAADTESPGSPAIRSAFVRVGQRGASGIGILDPVRFLQLAMIEAADWRPRSPDQHEPLSTQLAREMLEYGSGGAWPMAGEASGAGWTMSGGMSWHSLARLAGALGITESIGME